MILLKDMKTSLFKNADAYWKSNRKDHIQLESYDLYIGARFRCKVRTGSTLKYLYFTIISLDPAVIAYWIQDEFAIYLAPVDFEQLFIRRILNRRNLIEKMLHPQDIRIIPVKVLNSIQTRKMLWMIPRLTQKDVQSAPYSLNIISPKLIYNFSTYISAGKEDIFGWLLNLVTQANSDYHTGKKQSSLTDDQYDELKELLLSIDPKKAKILESVGAPVIEEKDVRKKVELEYKMGSLRKIKPDGSTTNKFIKDTKDDEYIVSDKLDGLSLSLTYRNSNLVKATTRGDGYIGQDVTRHILQVPSVPKKLNSKYAKENLTIRAEGILANSDFEMFNKLLVKEGNSEFANPRNMIAGVFNRLSPNKKVLAKLNVVTYAIMSREKDLDKKQQLKQLEDMGFHVVPYKVFKAKDISEEKLTKYISDRKLMGDFDLDGAVIEVNNAKIRQSLGNETNSINPKYAKAFKTGDTEKVEAKVLEVVWAVSKHGYLKPRIRIFPVKLGGVTVSYATAFNASFVYENKLGPGAKVLLTRSGDVIPHILKVIDKAKKPQMPDKDVVGNYEWNDTKVDLVLSEPHENDTVKIKQISGFFSRIGVDYLGRGLITRFYEHGFDSIDKVIHITVKDLLSIDGIQKKSAEKLYEGITKALQTVDLPTLASATPYFGVNFGETRLDKIYEVYKDEMFSRWKGYTVRTVAEEISKIPGFSSNTAIQFAKGIKPFNSFLKRNSDVLKINKKKEQKKLSNVFSNVSICWTGIRQRDLEELLIANGGKVESSVKNGLTYLVAKDPNSTSAKMQKARDLKIKIISPDQAIKLFKDKGVL
jgi:NAD-dependent DNA ligase